MTTRIVSFLGLGPAKGEPPYYTPISYQAPGAEPSKPTPLVQQALVEAFPDSGLLLLGTTEVHERWIASGLLAEHVKDARAHTFTTVPRGTDEGELWTLFDEVRAALTRDPVVELGETSPPERIVFDVTHGFRIQPMLGLAAVAFEQGEWTRQRLKNTPTVEVVYGAYEASQDGVAPIWDLTELLSVSQWTAAFNAFFNYGRADELASLTAGLTKRHKDAALHRGERGRELAIYGHLEKIGTRVRSLADDLATARTRDIFTRSAPTLVETLDHSATTEWMARMPVLRDAVDQLREMAADLCADGLVTSAGVRATGRLAKLYLRLERFSELAATLREGLVSHFAHVNVDPIAPEPRDQAALDRDGGNFAGARAVAEDAWNDLLYRHRDDRPDDLDDRGPAIAANLEISTRLQELRNDVEHAGYRDAPRRSEIIRKHLASQTDEYASLVAATPSRTGYFVNLSNHPVETWSKAQLQAARALELGAPVDLDGGVPLVPAAAKPKAIAELADELVTRVLSQGVIAACVQGEHSLSFALVARLQRLGVRCFVATTERDADQSARHDGSIERRSTFRFVRWREYPRLS